MSTELIERLRRITDEARRRADDEARRRAEAERSEAAALIEQIPQIASDEAALGRQSAAVMVTTYAGAPGFRDGVGYVLEAAQLSGAAAIVWRWCEQQHLGPHLVPRWTTLDTGVNRIDFLLCIAW